ncbi:molybdopterin/thiamine biosynthesis adenylyltransferase [Bradyrhizobium sp. GM5.1]
MLSPDELERYARHIVLRDVGGPGQAALKRASVLVIGAGGARCARFDVSGGRRHRYARRGR